MIRSVFPRIRVAVVALLSVVDRVIQCSLIASSAVGGLADCAADRRFHNIPARVISNVPDNKLTTSIAIKQPAEEAADHFAFGRNWSRFLSTLDDARMSESQQSVEQLLQVDTLESKQFLDAGSGSGLFSLAAYRLGANVTSFDLDPDSVACTRYLKSQFADDEDDNDEERWTITDGSLLDATFLASLGNFDVVYCWGVAHHTGDMWQAIENLTKRVAPGGRIVLALYNDQQYVSGIWTMVKRIYQKLPRFLRPLYTAGIGAVGFAKRAIVTALACVLRIVTLRNPFSPITNWIREGSGRGMHAWYDLIDWVGGWPFEVARPEAVFRFMRDRGFRLQEMTTSVGHGCNEFVFVRESSD